MARASTLWVSYRDGQPQDHLDATLFVDRALPHTLTFLREYERFVLPEARVVDSASAAAQR